MRLAWAFFVRDAIIAFSYRATFIVELFGNLLVLGVFYFIGKTIGTQKIAALEPYGGNFLAFLLIGIALTDCVGVSLSTFGRQIREGQTTGTLELTLISPVSLPVILIYSSLWAYLFSAVRLVLYLVLGGLLYRVGMAQANLVSALVIFLLTVLSFMGVGIVWAGIVLLVKRGESIMTAAGYLVILVSGVLFPGAVLPDWMQWISSWSPLTHALEGMRLALLRGFALGQMMPLVLKLIAFAAIWMTLGIATFNWAVRISKRAGSLAEY